MSLKNLRCATPVLAAILAVALIHAGLVRPCSARDPLTADEIKAGLRTTVIEENGFVDHVITMAQKGQLSWALIDSSFQYARKKNQHKFQYFKKALTVMAADAGVQI